MKAFQILKSTMISPPVLTLSDFSKAFVIKTNAFGVGLGVVLMQEGKLLAYFNNKLNPQAQAKSVYERELVAMGLAIKKWHPYHLRCKIINSTNEKSLKYLLGGRISRR